MTHGLDPGADVHCAAVHEAGHAVAGYHHGLSLAAIHIDPGPATCPGKCEFDENAHPPGLDWWGVARVDLATTRAGMIAEELFSGQEQHDVCDRDIEWSKAIIDRMRLEDEAYDGEAQIARTNAYLKDFFADESRWNAVHTIAGQLVRNNELDPTAVTETLADLLGPPEPGLDPAVPPEAAD